MSKNVGGFPAGNCLTFPDETIEMFALPEKEDFDKHVAISKLLDIPLKCPYCEKILKDKTT